MFVISIDRTVNVDNACRDGWIHSNSSDSYIFCEYDFVTTDKNQCPLFSECIRLFPVIIIVCYSYLLNNHILAFQMMVFLESRGLKVFLVVLY